MKQQKKQVTITVNKDLVHSWIEGGLWMMRLVEDGEFVSGLSVDDAGDYHVSLTRVKDKVDTRQLNLSFLGKDNP